MALNTTTGENPEAGEDELTVPARRLSVQVSSRRKVLAAIAASRRIYGTARAEDRAKIRRRRRVNQRHAYHDTAPSEPLESAPQARKEPSRSDSGDLVYKTRFHHHKVLPRKVQGSTGLTVAQIEAAALKIQSIQRGKAARGNVSNLKEQKQREAAAIEIQSMFRTKSAKNKVQEVKLALVLFKAQNAAAAKLQMHWRSKIARKKVERLRKQKHDLHNTPLLTHQWVKKLVPSDDPMPRRIVLKLFHRFAGKKKQLTLADLAVLLRDMWAREFADMPDLTPGYIQFVNTEVFDAKRRIFINEREFPELFDMYWTRRQGIRRKFLLIHPDGGSRRESILGGRAEEKDAPWQVVGFDGMSPEEKAAKMAAEGASLSAMRVTAKTKTQFSPEDMDTSKMSAQLRPAVKEMSVQTNMHVQTVEFGAPASTVRAASNLLEMVRSASAGSSSWKVEGPPRTMRLGQGQDESALWHFQGPPRSTTDLTPAGWAPAVGGLGLRDLNDQNQMSLRIPDPAFSTASDRALSRREGHIDSKGFLETSIPAFDGSMTQPYHSRAPKLMDPGKSQLRSPPPRAQEAPPIVALPGPIKYHLLEGEPVLADPLPHVELSAVKSSVTVANTVAASMTPQRLLTHPPQPPSSVVPLPPGIEPMSKSLLMAPPSPRDPMTLPAKQLHQPSSPVGLSPAGMETVSTSLLTAPRDPTKTPTEELFAPPSLSLGGLGPALPRLIPQVPQLSLSAAQPKRLRDQPKSPQKSGGPTSGLVVQPGALPKASIEVNSPLVGASLGPMEGGIPPPPHATLPLDVVEPSEKGTLLAIASAAENFAKAEEEQLRMILDKNLHHSFETHCVAAAVRAAAVESEREELRQAFADFEIGMQQKKQRALLNTLDTVQRLEKEQSQREKAQLSGLHGTAAQDNTALLTQAAQTLDKLADDLPSLLTSKPAAHMTESSIIAPEKAKLLGRDQLRRVFNSFCTGDGLLGASDFHRLTHSLHMAEKVSTPTVELSNFVFREVFGVEDMHGSISFWTFERYFNYYYAHREELKETFYSLNAQGWPQPDSEALQEEENFKVTEAVQQMLPQADVQAIQEEEWHSEEEWHEEEEVHEEQEEPFPGGLVYLKIVEGQDIYDPFAKTSLTPTDPSITVFAGDRKIHQTAVQAQSIKPVWNESCEFYIGPEEEFVTLQLNDSEQKREIGCVYLNMWEHIDKGSEEMLLGVETDEAGPNAPGGVKIELKFEVDESYHEHYHDDHVKHFR